MLTLKGKTLEHDSTIEKRDLTIEKHSTELLALCRRMFGRSSERFLSENIPEGSVRIGEEVTEK